MRSNPALNLAPFSRWTPRDKAAQRRLALRWASKTLRTLSALIIFSILLCGTSFAAEPSFPWKKGDPPPTIAGITLGASRERLKELFGEPSQVQNLGEDSVALVYKPQGIMALWAPLDGVAIIYVQTREAADIGGVRIGDTKGDVLARWGMPSTIQGATAIYRAGSWGAVVRIDTTDHVSQLSLGVLSP